MQLYFLCLINKCYYIDVLLHDCALAETSTYNYYKVKKEINGKLTKALKAGRWAAISYIQHPEQRKCFLAVAKRISDIHSIKHIPSDQISDLNP